MITIREVAKRAGVSAGTVSNVPSGSGNVRPELRQRVEEAMRALDYSPNQIARSLKTRTLMAEPRTSLRRRHAARPWSAWTACRVESR